MNTPVERPWGSYLVLADEPDHKVKRLVVNPGQRLSMQYHMKRDEHWYFISGCGKAIVDGHVYFINNNRTTIEVKREQRHRIHNTGDKPLVLIEVQTGDYFGEDDIIRTKDDYGRMSDQD